MPPRPAWRDESAHFTASAGNPPEQAAPKDESAGPSEHGFVVNQKRCTSIAFVVVLLAGCGAPATIDPPGSVPQTSTSARALRNSSWMLAEAKRETLLYVFGGNDNIYVYDYRPPFKLVGDLVTWSKGMCSDTSGNVFLTQPAVGNRGSSILEYAHGGTAPIATLTSNEHAYSCAFDPTSGDLAVVNVCAGYDYESGCEGIGSVEIYPHEHDGGKQYTVSGFLFYYYAGYDRKGDLFFDADQYEGGAAVAELTKSKQIRKITLDSALDSPGGVLWSASDLVVGDSVAGNAYRFTVRKTGGTLVGTTRLDDGFKGYLIVAGDRILAADTHDITIYRFPKGGQPVKEITPGSGDAYGFTLSVSPKH